jgi:NAD/NADP transhydrogenase beta subunit
MNPAVVAEAAFLIASLLFIIGLKRLSSPRTARSGNILAAIGMALALGGTFLLPGMGHFGWILLAIVLGTAPGWLLAKRVKMRCETTDLRAGRPSTPVVALECQAGQRPGCAIVAAYYACGLTLGAL